MSLPAGIELALSLLSPVAIDVVVGFLIANIITLIKYVMYFDSKIKHRKSLNKQSKPLVFDFKSEVGFIPRRTLLFIATTLPLTFITAYTMLLIALTLELLPSEEPLLLKALLLGLLLADSVFIHYFLSKYGAVYKLPAVFLKRGDARQFLEERMDLFCTLSLSSIIYLGEIIYLLTDLVYAPNVPSKIIAGIIVILLLGYVLPNNKYGNAVSLIERIWRE
jgi:hypothetical protein